MPKKTHGDDELHEYVAFLSSSAHLIPSIENTKTWKFDTSDWLVGGLISKATVPFILYPIPTYISVYRLRGSFHCK
ncbi:hypothetical protein WAI453_004505 [Rhynchosporium graminicola]